MADEDRTDDVKTLYRGEAAVVVCFDFQDFPEVTGGQTLSLPTVEISSGPSVVTLGLPAVTVTDFDELDRNGNVEKTVPAGAGVTVAVSPPAVGGAKGECHVTCLVKPSGSATGKIGKRCKFIVK